MAEMGSSGSVASVPVEGTNGPGQLRQVLTGTAIPALLGIIALLVIVGGITTSSFLTSTNLETVLRNASIVGIAAVSVSLVTISGNFISLSVQQSAMLAAILLATLMHHGWNAGAAVLACLVALTIVSVAQGAIVAAGLNPVVATLAIGTIIFGGVTYFTNGATVTFDASSLSWMSSEIAGIPVQVIFFLAFTAIVTFLTRRSVVGRELKLSGSNPETARLSGISTRKSTIWAFFVVGIALTLAGVLGASMFGQADTLTFETMSIDAATAVIVGGVAIQGGLGSPVQAALGAIFISLIGNILVLHGATRGVTQIVTGCLVIAAILIMHLSTGRRR